MANINILSNARNNVNNFLEAKRLAKQGTVLKILKSLTPKEILQRLPITLAQIKAGSNSESLLNETRQIVYSLYQSKNY